MSLSWELMTSDERKRAVVLADQRYALLMSGVSREGVTEVLRTLWTEIAPSRAPKADRDAEDTPWQP